MHRYHLALLIVTVLQSACNPREPTISNEGGVSIVRIDGAWLRTLPQARTWPEGAFHRAYSDSAPRIISGGLLRLDGRVVISNDATQTIDVFDTNGKSLASFGGRGGGPQEFRSVQLMRSAALNEIVVADPVGRGLVVTDSVGTIVERTRIASRRQPLFRFSDRSELRRIRSRLPDPTAEGIVRTRDQLVRESGDHRLADFGYHPADDFVLRPGSTGGLTGGEVPLGRRLLVEARDDLVVVAPTGEHDIYLYDPLGGLKSRISVQRAPTRVPDSFRSRYQDSVLALYGRDEYGRREWTLLTAPDVFPKHLPQFDAIALSQEYQLWVRDGSFPDSVSSWTVFDRSGLPMFRARLPGSFRVLDISSSSILGVTLDSEGLESLAKFRFEAPPAESR